ncbi:MAG: outer membrane protein assembly factor BamD [Planctomycetaceae bacterium]|nr:outer membrane protein assembly factor BamD [Planctomycetaceae bacterium]
MSAETILPAARGLRRGRRCLQWALLAFVLAGVSTLAGCATTLDISALKGDPAKRNADELDDDSVQLAHASDEEKKDRGYRPSIDGIMGPTERELKQASWEQQKREAVASGGEFAIEGLAEYEAAEKLYDAGNYRAAEKAFKKLAKARHKRGLTFWQSATESLKSGISDPAANSFGDPIEEDALFMVAESQFRQKKYSWAQDSYDRLLERYPSSRHLDDVTRRMFAIAQSWMGFPDAHDDNVELASGELQKTNPRTGDRNFEKPSFFNLADDSRPLFDTGGRALQALQTIWLHDANGPLADDALMLTANYHLQTGDFVEAARVYQLLREQYPDSPHFKDAYLLDSHVRLAAYEGPGYDDKSLNSSKDLKETAQRLFPDLDPAQRQKLSEELERISVIEIQREWHKVEFYQSKQNEAAVVLHCNYIINKYPDSQYAEQARKTLEEIADNRRNGPSSSLNPFRNKDESVGSPVFTGIVPHTPAPQQTAKVESPPARATLPGDGASIVGDPDAKQPPKPGFFRRMLTPVTKDPKLKPIDEDATNE